MALLFMDSFDHYVTADLLEKWTQSIVANFDTASAIGAFGRHSSNAIRWAVTGGNAFGRSIAKTLPAASGNTVVLGFGFRHSTGAFSNLVVNTTFSPTDSSQSNFMAGIRQGAAVQVWVRVNNTGTISVLKGSTVLGTSTLTLSAGTFVYIELRVVIDPAAGEVELRVNSVPWIGPLTSQNTRNTASSTWDEVVIGAVRTGVTTQWDIDDLYVLDGTVGAPWNTFLGDVRVDPSYPTAEGVSSAWTPSTGTNNALTIDETAPNDDTDYNSTSTVGATDTFVTQDAPVAGSVIYGVQHCLSLRKSDAGTCTVAPVIRPSTLDYPGTAISPGTTYQFYLQIAQTNPATGVQWTEAGFNAAEFGYKRVT